MSQSQSIDILLIQLRATELRARDRLIAGCTEDMAVCGRLFDRPMKAARQEAFDALAALGDCADPELYRAISRETFDRIGSSCAEKVCSNAALRARARFRIYVEEIAQVEDLIENALAAYNQATKRFFPRMFAIGALATDGFSIPSVSGQHQSEVSDWLLVLRAEIELELKRRVTVARDAVLVQGRKRLGIIRARVALALCAPSPNRPAKRVAVG